MRSVGLNAAFGKEILNHFAHAVFGNGTDGRSGNLQRNPLPGFGDKKFLELQIRIEPTLGFDIGVGNVVAFDGTLTG